MDLGKMAADAGVDMNDLKAKAQAAGVDVNDLAAKAQAAVTGGANSAGAGAEGAASGLGGLAAQVHPTAPEADGMLAHCGRATASPATTADALTLPQW